MDIVMKDNHRLKILVLLIMGLLTLSRGYNEPCDEDRPCEKVPGIICGNHVPMIGYEGGHPMYHTQCVCIWDNMFYDQDRQRCVVAVGGKCPHDNVTNNRPFVSVNLTKQDGAHYEEVIFYEPVVDCVKGAKCDDSGICECPKELRLHTYPETGCVPRKRFGERCEAQDECDHAKMLSCVEGECLCFTEDEEMYYDSDTKDCRIMVGRNCVNFSAKYENMTLKAFQDVTPGHRNKVFEAFAYAQCPNGSKCDLETGRCGFLCNTSATETCSPCPPNQYPSNNTPATCSVVKEKGDNCSLPGECNFENFLTCVNNKCDCDPEFTVPNKGRFYNNHYPRTACLAKVGYNCVRQGSYGSSKSHLRCVNGASCKQSVCSCDKPMKPTRDKFCGRVYNQDCNLARPCADYLVCTEGKCRCPNEDYQQHNERNRCCRDIGLVGRSCDPSLTPTSEICVVNAECARESEADDKFVCKCKTGFVPNSLRGCDIAHGWPCKTNHMNLTTSPESCDRLADLKCRIVKKTSENGTQEFSEICSCRNLDDVYDEKERKCVEAPISTVGRWYEQSGSCAAHNLG